MSLEDPTAPISPTAFRLALRDLPLSSLHLKAAELQNSISHLAYSNEQMLPFAEAGDGDCREAMFENLGVIGRMRERIWMCREEVEGRGGLWPMGAEGGNGDGEGGSAARGGEVVNGVDGVDGVNDTGREGGEMVNGVVAGTQTTEQRAPSGRLTDEELRRQLEAQMGGIGDDAEDEDEGVHL